MALQHPLPAEPPRISDAVPPIPPALPEQGGESTRLENLANALLDLESGYEGALRTVLSVHRLLEHIRCNARSPGTTLLVQEMSRKIAALQEGASQVGDRLDAVSRLVALLPSHYGE